VETRACTKILETIPNPDTFVGEPPHTARQPPQAVAKQIQTSTYFFSFLIVCIFIFYFYSFIFVFLFIYLYYDWYCFLTLQENPKLHHSSREPCRADNLHHSSRTPAREPLSHLQLHFSSLLKGTIC
jgi:hypothetical protein